MTYEEHVARAAEVARRVKITKVPRERYTHGYIQGKGPFREKSRRRIEIDGEHVGFTILPHGWGTRWELHDLTGSSWPIASVDDDHRAEKALKAFERGELKTASAIAAEKEAYNARDAASLAEKEERRIERERHEQERTAARECRKIAAKMAREELEIILRNPQIGAAGQYALAFAIEEIRRIEETGQ